LNKVLVKVESIPFRFIPRLSQPDRPTDEYRLSIHRQHDASAPLRQECANEAAGRDRAARNPSVPRRGQGQGLQRARVPAERARGRRGLILLVVGGPGRRGPGRRGGGRGRGTGGRLEEAAHRQDSGPRQTAQTRAHQGLPPLLPH
jgi:hypothetical protein